MFATEGYCGQNIVYVLRENYADGNLAVVGAVGGVESTGAIVEADFAGDFSAEGCGQGGSIELRGF
jgi:hypothetical protein